jgi:hypothetical protein
MKVNHTIKVSRGHEGVAQWQRTSLSMCLALSSILRTMKSKKIKVLRKANFELLQIQMETRGKYQSGKVFSFKFEKMNFQNPLEHQFHGA